jgi:hypothetical protein
MAQPKVPLTVEAVVRRSGGLWAVRVVYADLSTGEILIPETLASIDSVRFSALAVATLASLPAHQVTRPHRVHTRWAPRP